MVLHFSHIARYAPSIQNHIHLKPFAQILTIVMKHPLKGESVLLSSRIGMFKITPVSEDDTLTSRICKGLQEVKRIKEGKSKGYSVEELLDEL